MNAIARSALILSALSAPWSAAQAPASAERGAESQKLVVAVSDENGVAVARARVQLQAAQPGNPFSL